MKTSDLDAAQAHFGLTDEQWVKALGMPSVSRLKMWRAKGQTPRWLECSVGMMFELERLRARLDDIQSAAEDRKYG